MNLLFATSYNSLFFLFYDTISPLIKKEFQLTIKTTDRTTFFNEKIWIIDIILKIWYIMLKLT